MKSLFTLIISLWSAISVGQIAELSGYNDHEVFILGNLSENSNLLDVSLYIPSVLPTETHFTIVINGDLISPSTNNEKQFHILTNILLKIGDYPNGNVLILSGDADWDYGNETGFSSVLDLEKRIKKFLKFNSIENVKWVSKNGCPGPKSITLSDHLEVIALNSQWWNHREEKPSPSSGECEFAETSHIQEEIEDLIEKNKDKNVLILGHHPISSLGNYGGHFSLKDELTPFPLVGSFIDAYHAHIGDNLDISNQRLQVYNSMMNEILVSHQNLIYASSHEKNQQIVRLRNNYLINSGALFSSAYVSSNKDAVFRSKELGIIKITYKENGGVNSTFLKFDPLSNTFSIAMENKLFGSACSGSTLPEGTIINSAFVPCNAIANDITTNEIQAKSGTVTTAATDDYTKGLLHKIVFGTRYRKDWAEEINVPVLSLSDNNKLFPLKKGGGRQTTSLKLISETGDVYAFRSVNKDPSKALAFDVRSTVIGTIFKDQTSAQQPYGSLIIAPLLEPLDILHATPKLYMMPNSSELGKFQSVFGGMLGTLEEHPGKPNSAGDLFGDADKIVKSNDLFSKLYGSNNHQVDAEEFIRARLFDVLVADWSKHEDNWKWAAFNEGDKTIYRPIPRDRDMVLSKWNGILPFIADLPFGINNIEGFDHKIRGFRSQVFQARFLDRFISTQLSMEDFIKEAKTIQNMLTDELIVNSVKALPKEVFELSGEEIIYHLKQRRDDLVQYANTYFEWLNKDVELVGSNKKDRFEIEVLNKEKVSVKIYDFKKYQASGKPFFSRIFNSSETKLIRFYGLNGDDAFMLKASEKSKIQLVFIGGHGDDSYNFPPDYKSLDIYDLAALQRNSGHTKQYKNNWNHDLYNYDRGSLKFNSWIPSLSISYSTFQGFSFGLGNTWTRHKWDKRNFSSKHSVKGIYTTLNRSGLTYQGEWNEVIQKWNIKARSTIGNPNLNNSFYGVGDDSEFNQDLDTNSFFLTNYLEYSGNIGVSRRFWKKSELSIYTGYSRFESTPKSGSFLDIVRDSVSGASESISSIPFHLDLTLDLLDHSSLPTKGVRAVIDSEYNLRIERGKENFAFVSSSVEYYTSTRNKNKLTLGLKLAGTKGFGGLPYYKQSNLGGDTGLRGYTSNRFTGESRAFLNTELRWQLTRKRNEYSPAKFGILAFYDTGRVFEKEENIKLFSNSKSGYGTGFYVVPYSKSFTLSFTLAWSKEENFYPGFTFGTFLN